LKIIIYIYLHINIYKMGDYAETTLRIFEQWYEMGIKNGFFDLYHLSLAPTRPPYENYNLPLQQWQTQPIQPMYVPPLPPPPFEIQPRSFYPVPESTRLVPESTRPVTFYSEPPRPEIRPPLVPASQQQPRPPIYQESQPPLVPASQQQSRPPIYQESRPPLISASQDYQRSGPMQNFQRPSSIRRYPCLIPDHRICINWLKNKECSPTCQNDHTIYPLFKIKQCKFYVDKNCKYDDPVLCSHLHGDDPYDPKKRNYRKRGRFDM